MQYQNKREKTKNRIVDAFVALYEEKDIAQITVRMICEKAGINRSTFYTYYTDVYDLRTQKQTEIVNEVYETILSKAIEYDSFEMDDLARMLIEYLKKNNGVPLLFIKRGDSELVNLIFSIFRDKMKKKGVHLTEEQEHIILMSMRYHIHGVIALVEQEKTDSTMKDVDAFVDKVAQLANEGPIRVVQKQISNG